MLPRPFEYDLSIAFKEVGCAWKKVAIDRVGRHGVVVDFHFETPAFAIRPELLISRVIKIKMEISRFEPVTIVIEEYTDAFHLEAGQFPPGEVSHTVELSDRACI